MPTPAPSSPPGSPPAQADSYPAPPKNKGSAPFYVLAALFDRLQSERKPDKRRKLVASWFNHWRKEVGMDLYPVLRLILPQKDRERAVYGLKEKALAKLYIKLIPLGPYDPDAIRLTHWKKPSDRGRTSGDFPMVLYEVINKRSSIIEGSCSIEEINDYLDRISQSMGKSEAQWRILQDIYSSTTPEEQKWIARIILKDMNISVKENTVFSIFHPDAHDLFNTCSDLKKVAYGLWDPELRLGEEEKAVQLFRSFAPMLCKRPTKRIEDSVKEMGGGTFIIEEKLDGERMQLHKRGNEYFYCSRKGKDYTYLYGKHVGTGSLTPYIDAAFDERVDEIILDGEMLVWDPVSERNLPFGTLKTAALDKSKKEHNPRPCFKVFDLLYLNGMSLLNRSTKFRKRNLKSCLQEIHGRIEFTGNDVRKRMEEIMANRGEGLILKHPDSQYILNGRNKDWIKVKPEYMSTSWSSVCPDCIHLSVSVDDAFAAGNYGSGRRSGGVSTLICAVIDDRRRLGADEELNGTRYSTFVRIGSGFSYADYVWIRQKPWKQWGAQPPAWLQVSKKGTDDKGDLYLEPEDSFIVKVKAAEITTTDQYHLGFTMRFPRALHVREDLTIADCMSATAVIETMRSEKKRKMDDAEGEAALMALVQPMILPEYRGINVKDVKVESQLFKSFKFMVSSDPKSRSGASDKNALLQMIHAHGGKFQLMARDDPDLLIVYGGKTTPYDLKLVMNKDICDIIRPSWIIDCTDEFQAALDESMEEPEAHGDPEDDRSVTLGTAADDSDTEPEEDEDETESAPPPRTLSTPIRGWFDVGAQDDASSAASSDKGKGKNKAENGSDSGSETEVDELDADSENEDSRGDADAFDDDWEQVDRASQASVKAEEADEDVKMGVDDGAMHYDEGLIFKHLCFYVDSPTNARANGMTTKGKHEATIEKHLAEISKSITDHGGRVSGLDDSKLTHIVVDKRDDSRRQELIKRTSKPKRRHVVIAEFIEACLEEDTLLDEDDFVP
ncbi:DNA ligase 4 [Epithele typhae]|uniref:DNA ligase 4 n=1 Tax=Epithele typhae TaxID=378194 RepID=UPI002007AFA4|nr:DNA ligase 4 [Epithele typhae]KAH9935959.1 DNA ligase 4 [Epithele typhae]